MAVVQRLLTKDKGREGRAKEQGREGRAKEQGREGRV
jgi:hypothetical protein